MKLIYSELLSRLPRILVIPLGLFCIAGGIAALFVFLPSELENSDVGGVGGVVFITLKA